MITVRVTQTDAKETVFIIDNPLWIQFRNGEAYIHSVQDDDRYSHDRFKRGMWKKIEVENE